MFGHFVEVYWPSEGLLALYREVAERADRIASGLHSLGVKPGDSVCMLLRNDIAFIEAAYAAMRLGAYGVPINWHFTPDEANHILQDCGAKVLVAHTDLLAQIAGGVPEGVKVLAVPTPPEIAAAYNVSPEKRVAPAGVELWRDFVAASPPRTEPPKAARGSMIYTSGTTGRPKGVRRRPSTPEQQAAASQEAAMFWGLKPDPEAVMLMNGPMYHSAPAAYGMATARLGLHMVLQPRFEAEVEVRGIDTDEDIGALCQKAIPQAAAATWSRTSAAYPWNAAQRRASAATSGVAVEGPSSSRPSSASSGTPRARRRARTRSWRSVRRSRPISCRARRAPG